jgi:hypothetical protein
MNGWRELKPTSSSITAAFYSKLGMNLVAADAFDSFAADLRRHSPVGSSLHRLSAQLLELLAAPAGRSYKALAEHAVGQWHAALQAIAHGATADARRARLQQAVEVEALRALVRLLTAMFVAVDRMNKLAAKVESWSYRGPTTPAKQSSYPSTLPNDPTL